MVNVRAGRRPATLSRCRSFPLEKVRRERTPSAANRKRHSATQVGRRGPGADERPAACWPPIARVIRCPLLGVAAVRQTSPDGISGARSTVVAVVWWAEGAASQGLVIRLVIRTIRRDPSGSVWTDGAPNLSRPDPPGTDQIDAEHQATDLVIAAAQ
jgi:hypothetical protein